MKLGRDGWTIEFESTKKCQQEWTWAINNIERELNFMFIYNPVPIRRDVLERYVYRFISNDR